VGYFGICVDGENAIVREIGDLESFVSASSLKGRLTAKDDCDEQEARDFHGIRHTSCSLPLLSYWGCDVVFLVDGRPGLDVSEFVPLNSPRRRCSSHRYSQLRHYYEPSFSEEHSHSGDHDIRQSIRPSPPKFTRTPKPRWQSTIWMSQLTC
jgi:hypothetical protein